MKLQLRYVKTFKSAWRLVHSPLDTCGRGGSSDPRWWFLAQSRVAVVLSPHTLLIIYCGLSALVETQKCTWTAAGVLLQFIVDRSPTFSSGVHRTSLAYSTVIIERPRTHASFAVSRFMTITNCGATQRTVLGQLHHATPRSSLLFSNHIRSPHRSPRRRHRRPQSRRRPRAPRPR